MSSTQHTQGRIAVRTIDGSFGSIESEDGLTQIAQAQEVSVADRNAGWPERRGNARRLVACWNALEHLTTEGIERLADQGGAMPDQRVQQLVDALAKTETYLQERVGSNPGSRGATVILPMIRAAIEGAGVAPTQSTWADC